MNILIVGVGGQGTLLTSRVLGKYAELSGYDCKLSEVHGMSQRGGSVVTHVRFAEKLYSPIIWEGGADVILSFEKMEALRYIHYLSKDGVVLTNDVEIYPMPVITGAVKYPTDIADKIKQKSAKSYFIDATSLSIKAGSSKAVNIVMLGALAKVFNFNYDKMKEAVTVCVPQKFLDLNLKAFDEGYNNI